MRHDAATRFMAWSKMRWRRWPHWPHRRACQGVRHGLGDCFLLSIHGEDNKKAFMLIDCGLHGLQANKRELFEKVLLIIITLLYAAIALAIPLLLKYTFLVTYEDNMEYISLESNSTDSPKVWKNVLTGVAAPDPIPLVISVP